MNKLHLNLACRKKCANIPIFCILLVPLPSLYSQVPTSCVCVWGGGVGWGVVWLEYNPTLYINTHSKMLRDT